MFPVDRFGEFEPRSVKLTFSEYVKSRLFNKDSRYRKKPDYMFYFMHQKISRDIKSGIFNCLKNTKHRQSSVGNLLLQLNSKNSELEGSLSTVLQSMRGTKQYWQMRNGELFALVRDFGPPTLFLTFSCAEYASSDITEYLKMMNSLNPKADANIAQLCTKDPLSVSRQFSHRFSAMLNKVIIKGEVLGKVTHHFWKKEY